VRLFLREQIVGTVAEGAFDVRVRLEVAAAERVDALVSDIEVVLYHRQHVLFQKVWWLTRRDVAVNRAERYRVEDPVTLRRKL
jgi:hypothetical protein